MAVWGKLFDDTFQIFSEFLNFLKNANILESYTFIYSNNKSAMEIQEKTFLPSFMKFIENLKELLAQCDRLNQTIKENDCQELSIETQTIVKANQDIKCEKNEQEKSEKDFELNDENVSQSNWEELTSDVVDSVNKDKELQQLKECSTNTEVNDADLSEIHMVVMTNSSETVADEPSQDVAQRQLSKPEPLQIIRLEDGNFSCPTCDKIFTSKPAIIRHNRSHTGERPFSCELCPKRFASKTSVESHLLREHSMNTESALSCSECGKLFVRRSALDVHLLTHSKNKPFSCEICGRTFTQKITRDIHVAGHTGKYDYRCSVCRKEFASQAKLNAHMFVHRVPRFNCELCGRMFVRRDTLLVHQRSHTDERPFQCTACPKAFHSRSNLSLHQQLHNSTLKFKCPECGAQFKQKTSLNAHVKRRHSAQAQSHTQRHYLCSECGHEFRKKQSLTQHERVHQPLSAKQRCPHICHLCSRQFAHKSKLNAHIRTHIQEPQFACEICGKRFHRKDVRNHHEYLHTSQRPYSCAHCGTAFASKFNLSAHMATHNQSLLHQCLECGQGFKHKSTLALHRKAHSGLFNYTCAICSKKFLKKSHYESHLRSHDPARPFQCPTCGKRYKERKHWREHARRLHPNTFSLESLIASIADECVTTGETMLQQQDAQVNEMLCGNTGESVPQQQEMQGNEMLCSNAGESMPQHDTRINEILCMNTADTIPQRETHINEMLCSNAGEPVAEQQDEINKICANIGKDSQILGFVRENIHEQQQSEVTCPISKHSTVANINTGFLLDPQTGLSQAPIPMISVSHPVFQNLEPMLPTEASPYNVTPSSTQQQQVDMNVVTSNTQTTPTGTAVLSQCLQP